MNAPLKEEAPGRQAQAPENKDSTQGISHPSAKGKSLARHFGYLIRRQKKHPNGPDMRGSLNIDGRTFELAGWVRLSKNNKKYLSITAEEAVN